MASSRLLFFLLLATPLAHADSWTYVGTLSDAAAVADGHYDVRLTLIDGDASRAQINPINLHGVAIADGAFALELDLGAATQASDGQSADSLALTTELSSDGIHFVAISSFGRFDLASARRGVCWGSAESSQPTQLSTACLLPTSLLAQMVPAGGVYELRKQVIAGGGRLVTGGSYSLTGTVGQSAVTRVSGGVYQLAGGFHSAAAAGPPRPDLVFKNGFEN